jgi:hypothetical protein
MPRRAAWVSVVVGLAIGGVVLAQAPTPPRPVPHEDVPSPPRRNDNPVIGESAKGGMPTAVEAGDKVLPKPKGESPADKPPPKGEPVLGKGGFAADRATDMRPDENTGPDSTLHYVSVFNPDVLPFKRMSAFDAVRDDESLFVARTALTEIAVGGTTDARTRDRFWGDVLVQLKPGVDVPLPSVAPDMRILSYEAKPPTRLVFSKDGADNFYVRSDESSASGTIRVIFLADADAGYFAPALPKEAYTMRELAAKVPPELRVQLPSRVQEAANRTLRNLDIDRSEQLPYVFNKLVGYFRAFQPKDINHPSGDIYRDLCDSQAGVCRHRSFAFMITANALGLPTRYVENEAHAFVEVWFPDRGWQRIDLGGAALRMEVTGADNKTLHRPRAEDPFAKPPEYKQNYTQLEGDIRGLTDRQIADKRQPLDQAPSSGATGGGAGQGAGSGAGNGGPDRVNPNQKLKPIQRNPGKKTPELRVTAADTSAYRGDTIHVEGIAVVEGRGLGDHLVRVFLAPAHQDGEGSKEIGHALTNADGTFRLDAAVPGDLNLSSYEIFLSSDEDAHYNGALSD